MTLLAQSPVKDFFDGLDQIIERLITSPGAATLLIVFLIGFVSFPFAIKALKRMGIVR